MQFIFQILLSIMKLLYQSTLKRLFLAKIYINIEQKYLKNYKEEKTKLLIFITIHSPEYHKVIGIWVLLTKIKNIKKISIKFG